jgi:hypothetical protein
MENSCFFNNFKFINYLVYLFKEINIIIYYIIKDYKCKSLKL